MMLCEDERPCICPLFTLCWCSLLEQKVEHLTKMTDEVTKRQLEREDTALQYKRFMV